MRCGISTACFYPESTLDSLRHVNELGSPITEIFLNTFHEVEPDYIRLLKAEVDKTGIDVVSLHPFSSAMEGFFFATPYAGRFQDGMALYLRFFEAARQLGADKLVFHGDHKNNPADMSDADYAGAFRQLAQVGLEYGVTLCHENVYYCRLNSPVRIRQVRPLMGANAAFVLDTKQLQREGAGLDDMLDAMDADVRHLHISDYTDDADCIPPGEGRFDFQHLLRRLHTMRYTGDMVIELYRGGFKEEGQLRSAMEYINTLIQQTEKAN